MTKKKIVLIMVLTAIMSAGLTIGAICAALGLDAARAANMARFFGVMRLIEMRYVTPVDDETLIDGAISGMVQSLDDPHSIYMKASMFKELREQTEGEFGGIGVTMGFKDSKVTIISVLEGTPGEAAGLMAGDEIIAVDGTSVTEWQPEEVALHIRGEIDTNVVLTIRRAGEDDHDYTLTRTTIKIHSVKGKMIDGTQIGYLRIASFAEHTGEEFKQELSALEAQDMKGLILDLRQNPGGLITSCVKVANEVVPKGTIVSVVERDGSKEEYTSSLEAPKYPIVVLIDGNSASASEILSGALQDTGAATLVGTTSYGKGSVQMVLPLLHDDGIKLTIAKYYTPNGRSIDGTGITPDVEVGFSPGDTQDVQLEKAEEVMEEKLAQ
ncbi:S41 family peptidase [Mitsuokella sp. oral taxon 131]|uniref:S41 family peptidase n=1 Tax=Mitsuokella sp. oral taxon 131 TaxID=1321780 RepID=UPI0003AD7F85|nr:S41 family peptidase [Mitsuokella sp. oral taxon 131]ERL05686.1 peptidase, S41 family [Mitsuokella sp. oral taxon 131 str. W9106]